MNNNMEENRIPQHVSIIMDGNGRWAKERGHERVYGHAEGVESVRACIEAAAEYGVRYLSLFAFSEENWGRPEGEVDYLMEMMGESMVKEMPALMKNDVRFVVLGNRSRLSESLNKAIDESMAKTSANRGLVVIIFLSYSGRWDILQAVHRIAKEAASEPQKAESLASMTQEDFEKYLVTADFPEPDLIIRTSGECRISNYLLWQSAYSEFIFTDVMWPDFRKPQFKSALESYTKRERRYGKVK